jgi:hypothetical protein
MAYSELMERYGFIPANHEAPKFFDVECRKIYDERGEELGGYKRVCRLYEGSAVTLHVASDGYKLITNEEAFGGFEDALRSSSLDLTDMHIGTDYSDCGARVFRQYLLPAHMVEVKPGVEVALRLLMFNSYNGSVGFSGQCGAFNFVCANTSISGNNIKSFKFRHSGNVDVRAAIGGLVEAAEEHVRTTRLWKSWPGIQLSDLQARDLIEALPMATKSLVDHLVHRWVLARHTDERQGGPNLWCLFNVLTSWATHGEVREDGTAKVRFDREARVAKLTESKDWLRYAMPSQANRLAIAGPVGA